MKKLFLSALAVLLMTAGCTSANKGTDEDQEPESMEVEEETEIETDEGEASDGM